jgi:hexokinase
LICGTGTNSAIFLPADSLSAEKFGHRPSGWADMDRNVVVNTECSMLGGGIFPTTAVDRKLDMASDLPGFQPFEQLTSGRYLGEVVRLTLEEAGMKLFDRWSLSTELMTQFERYCPLTALRVELKKHC